VAFDKARLNLSFMAWFGTRVSIENTDGQQLFTWLSGDVSRNASQSKARNTFVVGVNGAGVPEASANPCL